MRLRTPKKLREQRGVALVGMALGMVAFTALAVASVDLARLSFTANEVQTIADVGATAGIRALLDGQNVLTSAQNAVTRNSVDGQPAAINPPGTVVVGTYDSSNQSFTPGGSEPNAVQANAERTVNNFLGAILGFPQTVVQKTAIAVYQTTGSGVPTLPLAIGDCHFEPDCVEQSCLPSLSTVPSGSDNSGWTGFFGGSGQSDILDYFPTPCGDGEAVPEIEIGDEISLNNGNIAPLFRAVRAMVCNGINEFLIPVVECDNQFNQTSTVTGFATITITGFQRPNDTWWEGATLCQGNPGCSGGQAPKRIKLGTLFRADTPGGPPGTGACTGCGTGYVTMVN